jgi:hypothetical protein
MLFDDRHRFPALQAGAKLELCFYVRRRLEPAPSGERGEGDTKSGIIMYMTDRWRNFAGNYYIIYYGFNRRTDR